MNNIIETKSFKFATRIVKLYQYLMAVKHEFVLSKQLVRSGTSIGANVAEAERAQTRADFHAKMSIALKEAGETIYWIRLLYAGNYLTTAEYSSIEKDSLEILAILTAICKSTDN